VFQKNTNRVVRSFIAAINQAFTSVGDGYMTELFNPGYCTNMLHLFAVKGPAPNAPPVWHSYSTFDFAPAVMNFSQVITS